MKPDPIVEEVRRAREAHAARFNYDLAAICAHLRQREKTIDHPVISRQPRFLSPIKSEDEEVCDSKISSLCTNFSSAVVEAERTQPML